MLESSRLLPRLRGSHIHVRKLNLTNFRNYSTIELCLDSGTTVIEGPNGHGKSNLLEAIHMLSAARSTRTSTELELVNSRALSQFPVHTQIAGAVETQRGPVRLQIDLTGTRSQNAGSEPGMLASHVKATGVHKTLRVNGVNRRSAEFVGTLKAVLFTPDDLDLTSGPPQVRRRFMDMLIAQFSHRYLVEWQEFNRVMRQRNNLLRAIRDGSSTERELEFWDLRFAVGGARIMADRAETLSRLNVLACPIHQSLSGSSEPLSLEYLPSARNGSPRPDARDLANALLEEVRSQRSREIAAGHSLIGPHRDDLRATIGELDVAGFASRGQARTVVLAMKLAEAKLISEALRDQPVLLLDDVMSELDPSRQRHVLDFTSDYEQVIITTAESGLAGSLNIDSSRRLSVESGRLAPVV